MKKTIVMLLVAALASFASEGDDKAKPLPPPKRISEGLHDMTERWQSMYGLDGKLKVSTGRRDARAAPADGAEFLSFDAQPKEVGWYAFTFIRVDALGRTHQVHTVRLSVHMASNNSQPPLISPEAKAINSVLSAAPGSTVQVKWSYYPGGEGIEGGWKLMSTSYSKTKLPPSVPGYEKATGE